MSQPDLGPHVKAALERGAGEDLPGAKGRILVLATLDSGARCGLDEAGAWILVNEGAAEPVRFSTDGAYLFHEALEWKRSRFEAAIEEGARALGLPESDVVFSFPAVDVVRAVLAKQAAYMTRLALEWLLPSELRELRADIAAVRKQDNMPAPVKQLAERLIVPE